MASRLLIAHNKANTATISYFSEAASSVVEYLKKNE